MADKSTLTTCKAKVHPLRAVLEQMYRHDLLKIATALGSHPRSQHYRDVGDLIGLIISASDAIDLKDDWLLRVNRPWTMFLLQPAAKILRRKRLPECSTDELKEICRQYSIKGFSTTATKDELVDLVDKAINDKQSYPQTMYLSRVTKKIIPSASLIVPRDRLEGSESDSEGFHD